MHYRAGLGKERMKMKDTDAEKKLSSMATCAVVYIEKCENGIPSGRIINHFLEEPVSFHGIGDFVVKMDAVYDLLGLPRPDYPEVTFLEGEKKAEYGFTLRDKPADGWDGVWLGHENYITLLVIHTQHRYNASWQGRISWPEKRIEKLYSSTLDCIKLMMEAVEYCGNNSGI